ncbi:unnamed protein product [Triticum turgidum subsp. durum]|uniref:Leucine-rich repeat-containing N-terminal plant-type domain-containing protein n=1 Tax=Triticum turgidum subsp. durum TaxID=4567 RepID=A0A9R1C6R6_TRITD|nr:unnamed protein product [Triticum turgidum subsp. durum]
MTKLALLVRATALLLCLLISQAASTSHGQATVSEACLSSERDALLSFKASLFDPAGHLSSWRRGDNCCQWNGVRCSNRTGHVIKLNLRNIDMDTGGYPNMSRSLSLSAGEMSSSLATLQHLRYLDLSGNDFTGTSIPVFMGSFGKLRYLNLSWAYFTGTIPSQLGNLSKLQYLYVSGNYDGLRAVDLAWLTRLPLLSHLDMSFVYLSFVRDWVHTFNMLPSLKVLRLSECGLNSTMSASNLHSKSNLTHLGVLDMSYNYFLGTSFKHNWFWNLTSLKELYLSGFGWDGPIPNELRNMKSLQVIDLSWNDLEGLLPSNLEDLCDLKTLKLNGNNVNANMDEFMDRLPMCSRNTLQELWVVETNMTGNLPVWIGNMTNLTVLEASYNMLTGPLPVGVGALGNLKTLDLSYNNFSGVLVKEHFTNLGNLESLCLNYNNFSGVLLKEHFTSLGNLESLRLNYNNFSGVLFKGYFASLGNLKFLDLSYNNFSGVLLREHFVSLGNLESLRLSYNKFSGVLFKGHFTGLGNLKFVDLSYNNFSGVLLREHFAAGLCNLEWLDLSYNNFSSVLLKEHFESLRNLKFSDLGYNNFSGVLLKRHSTSLGNLKHLDLSYNKLNSVLTEEDFAGLLNLEYLDLSYNSLKLAINQKWVPPFRLKVAGFRSCHLGPHFPEWLKWQIDIDVLVLGNSNLDDVIPDWFWFTFFF